MVIMVQAVYFLATFGMIFLIRAEVIGHIRSEELAAAEKDVSRQKRFEELKFWTMMLWMHKWTRKQFFGG